jgi:hypothetical protein
MRKTLMAAAASAALIAAGPAFAQHHGGGGGPPAGAGPAGNPGSMAGMHSQGPMNASPTGIGNASTNSVLNSGGTSATRINTTANFSSNSPAAQNSQALQHASPTAIAHASENSVLARGSTATTSLNGLATNMTVQNSTGTIGTISQIIYGPSNTTIRAVVVTSPSGQTYTLPANTLTINGTTVTTTSTIGG